MKSLLACFLFLFNTCLVLAQDKNSIWVFGDSSGIDFGTGAFPTPIRTGIDSRGSCSSISDSTGHLLFYCFTRATIGGPSTLVYNTNHQLMENGDTITGEGWYNELVIVPKPNTPYHYYIFSLGVIHSPGLYYSEVDMSMNNGLGKIITKNSQVGSYLAWDAMAAVKHGNGVDWWLVTKNYDYVNYLNIFFVYLITKDTIVQTSQLIGTPQLGNGANITFNSDGSKLLLTTLNGLIETYDFDRCSGLFSNANQIINFQNTPRFFGSCFSPSGRFVYVSTNTNPNLLWQLDLNSTSIWSSRILLATIPSTNTFFGQIKLAPDNKLYMASAWWDGSNYNYPYPDSAFYPQNTNLSVVNFPDNLGTACDLTLNSFYLGGTRVYYGLPNNPNYSLPALAGSVCDTLLNDEFSAINNIKTIQVSNNPTRDFITISLLEEFPITIKMYNEMGQFISEFIIDKSPMNIDLTKYNSGLYILKFETKQGSQSMKILKI